MDDPAYASVLLLRDIEDDQKRGYRYEQFIRELLPWDFKPPISVSGESEQFDAFFEWNSWHFLVESKAKKGRILRGSHDWEDFELKVRKRRGGVIGLFCSLNAADDIVPAAEALNREGMTTIVLEGKFWDELIRTHCPVTDVLRYMVANARSRYIAAPPQLRDVLRWAYDREVVAKQVETACLRTSALFLRRHKLAHHEKLYVPRLIDSALHESVRLLKPSSLRTRSKERRVKNARSEAATVRVTRDVPRQIFIVRDASGAGKTTLSVELALTTDPFFGVARAALETDLDRLDDLLDGLGPHHGYHRLISVDRPLIVVTDSLDEAREDPHKHSEVLSLLRLLDSLNEEARARDLLAFPIGFIFTVREDYWERWATLFEGRNTASFRKTFSEFHGDEITLALERYSSVYHYRLTGDLTEPMREALSVPFNLHVFSEANQFQGPIPVDDAFPRNVLGLYFARKREDVLKRRIPGLAPKAFMKLLGAVAYRIAKTSDRSIARHALYRMITDAVPQLAGFEEEIALAVVSERILISDAGNEDMFRFRHSRFVEYLAAFDIVQAAAHDEDIDRFGKRVESLMSSATISPFRVHEDVLFITEREFPNLHDRVVAFYAASTAYMTEQLGRLRADLAHGEATADSDMALVFQASEPTRPDVAWDAFFVIAAASNRQPAERLIEAFDLAWKSNAGRADRWKLLAKIAERDLILDGAVVGRIVGSRTPKEWEVFLGSVLADRARELFLQVWLDVDAPGDLRATFEAPPPEWKQAVHLLQLALHNRDFVSGDVT